ncbi:phosphoglycerate mutase [Pseudoxanthomonas suwonensis]|uniref:Phosphoglycerate mutase n=1 Tax=Pseudoxanthomonas suwonensis TaxID=314722 RepID=A0A0E3Z380_9GAMM|nr:phosphoglycerate mutase [Pseudoxanthomonas suwonensis]AKC87804.1 phosphoglycerate mutase [Pseudoxanthomonas suwonensis]
MATITLLLPERTRLPGPLPAAVGRVLARADREHGEAGGQAQLRRHFRLVPDHWPIAALTRLVDAGGVRGDLGGNTADLWLRADPAHVAPDLNGARLLGWGEGLGMDAEDAAAFLPALRPLFGDAGFHLDAPHPARWYLRLPEGTRLPALPGPDEALGDDLFAALPQGEDAAARRWRALITEAQVVLHQHPRNRERAARGRPSINALWFWGAGRLPVAVQSRYLHVRSQDTLLQGLARMAGAAIATPEAADGGPAGDSLVDMRRLRSLDLFGVQVLPPLLQAMARREFDVLQLDFEDGAGFRLHHGQRRWQFWRRPLAALARPAD